MAIVGVVARWRREEGAQREVRARLLSDARVTCGPSTSEGIALTIEASTAEVSTWLVELGTWPGVELVTPVFHEFEDELPAR
ncbi:hypothetical protein [Sandaracinus amylolyticus]|uniref:hypothetical protein n=1 Tax=Sandaracinus amylolyticus TaxID=927083 RepID=UPI001F184639|nr:hypothetical protein [Sandaracinus amylolyticus]UJR84142.1 Hypothetical protein I5071_62130 [Sandaracinus amylolyticus]